jgi:hypothetical protein
MAHLPPKFGSFEPLQRLGAGGMAETFIALRRGPAGFEQRVCIKRILPAYEADQEFVRAFLLEARTSAALRHTNIVQVLDFGLVAEEGSHYLALELIDGLDLRGLMQRGAKFDAELVTLIASELGAALEYAHSTDEGRAQVIHRDISPSNVLVSRAGEVKLTDFGIARVVGVGQRTATGVIKGKVPYMPPEYIEHGRFDQRGDLFALGVLLFELLTGERPFDGESELDTLRRIVAGERRALDVSAPSALIHCVERLIATKADERFASARALLDALPSIAVNPTRRRLAELVRALTVGAQLAPAAAAAAIAAVAPLAATERAQLPVLATRTAAQRSLRPTRKAIIALVLSASLLGALAGTVMLRLNLQQAGASAGPPRLPALEAAKQSEGRAESLLDSAAVALPPQRELAATQQRAALTSESSGAPAATLTAKPPRQQPPPARANKPRDGAKSSATTASAELRVVVVPFGEVWVDDKYLGQSPVSLRLAPGTHAIAVGEGRVRERRIVSLEPGEREQVVFRPVRAASP